MADAGEVKARVVIEYDGSGIDAAKADLEKLAGLAGSFGGEGGIGDAISAMGEGFAEGSKGAGEFANAIDAIEEPVRAGETAISDLNDTLGEHQQAIEGTGEAYKALQEPLGTTVAQLRAVQEPMAQIAERAQSLAEQIQPVADNFAALQDIIAQQPQLLPPGYLENMQTAIAQFAQGTPEQLALPAPSEASLAAIEGMPNVVEGSLQDVTQAYQDYQDFTKQFNEGIAQSLSDSQIFNPENVKANMAAFTEAINSPDVLDPIAHLQDYLDQTGQSWEDFTGTIGEGRMNALYDMVDQFGGTYQVSGGAGFESDLYARAYGGVSTGFDQASNSAGAFTANVENAQKAMDEFNQSDPWVNTATGAKDASENVAGIGGAIEDVNKAASGGFFGSLFGEGGVTSRIGEGVGGFFGSIGDGIDTIGESVNGFMMGLQNIAMPLMAVQMLGTMAQSAGAWIYNANLQNEGPNANSPYSYTSQASLLGANVTLGGNQFATGIGQGLLPAIEGWNAASGSASNSWQSIGDAIGTALGIGGSGLQMMGGGLSWLLGGGGLFGNNPLVQAGQNWMTSGYEGDVNTIAQLLGQPAPFTTSSIYSGQDIAAAYQQSHYIGVSGPGDPMNAYMQAVAMNTAAGPNGYQTPYPAPNADVAADWQYFNSMPYNAAYWTDAGSLPSGGYGGTVTQQDVARQMNYGTPTNWAGGIGSLISGGNPGVTEAGNTVGNSIGDFFGGLGQDWHNLGQSVSSFWGLSPQASTGTPDMGYTGGIGAGAGVGNATGMTDYLRNTSNGSMTSGGIGSEAVQLTHTFTANVTWQANNLEHQATATAHWAESGLAHEATAVAHWAEEGLTHMATAAAHWAEENLTHMATAAAHWAEENLTHMATATAQWAEEGLTHMATAVAQWTENNVVHPVVAAAEWAEKNLEHEAVAVASWGEKNLEHLFTGNASWQGENLTHTFFATAQWVMGGMQGTPAYAEGTSSHPGGPAIVGEGGAPEVVEHNGQFLLFDQPSFVDLPAGASVYPMRDLASGSAPRQFASGTVGDTTPISLSMGSGSAGAHTANINVYIDSQMLIQAIGMSLQQTINVGLGKRSF